MVAEYEREAKVAYEQSIKDLQVELAPRRKRKAEDDHEKAMCGASRKIHKAERETDSDEDRGGSSDEGVQDEPEPAGSGNGMQWGFHSNLLEKGG